MLVLGWDRCWRARCGRCGRQVALRIVCDSLLRRWHHSVERRAACAPHRRVARWVLAWRCGAGRARRLSSAAPGLLRTPCLPRSARRLCGRALERRANAFRQPPNAGQARSADKRSSRAAGPPRVWPVASPGHGGVRAACLEQQLRRRVTADAARRRRVLAEDLLVAIVNARHIHHCFYGAYTRRHGLYLDIQTRAKRCLDKSFDRCCIHRGEAVLQPRSRVSNCDRIA